jgi:hypothetical protein
MIIKISSKASKTQISSELKKISKRRVKAGFNAKKYFGKLIRGLDGEEYQKVVRNEWS